MADGPTIYSIAALSVSIFSILISAITAWLTLLRSGAVKMTQPTVIFFGFDERKSDAEQSRPKVFLRTLIFSTAKRGRILESIYVRLQCEDIVQDFNVWVYGERNELVRGSGLFVSETGVEANHHFLAPTKHEAFQFIPGNYELRVVVNLLGIKKPQQLFVHTLTISEQESDLIGEQDAGLYFDWDPEKRTYVHHLSQRPRSFWEPSP